MTQLAKPENLFGEVNVFPQPDGSLAIKATILWEDAIDVEGARAALALDASTSMRPLYGAKIGPFSPAAPNQVEPVARDMAHYLTRFTPDGSVTLLYWACHPSGAIEEIGTFSDAQIDEVKFNGPVSRQFGRTTLLLPPVKHLVESLADAPWALVVLLTDGKIDDLEDVKEYSFQIGHEIASGRRSPIKLVLIGLGDQIDEGQMEVLDDLFEDSGLRWTDPRTGRESDVDLWDHKIAANMRSLADTVGEVFDEHMIVSPHGKVTADTGVLVREYSDGLPALLQFVLPPGSRAFTIECPDFTVTQDISEVC